MAPLSADANSSRGPIFEIEELQDKKVISQSHGCLMEPRFTCSLCVIFRITREEIPAKPWCKLLNMRGTS
jgi:hypothetical protein